jgi:ketosteroid isomerase-like protein
MSEEENLSIVKQLEAEDFSSQTSRQTVMNGLAEDVEWWVAGPPDLLPWAGTFRGHEEVSRCLRASLENLKYEKWDFIDWITKGDDVVEFVHARGYAKDTPTGRWECTDHCAYAKEKLGTQYSLRGELVVD